MRRAILFIAAVSTACASTARFDPDPPEIVSFSVPAEKVGLLVPELAGIDARSAPAAALESGAAAVNAECHARTAGPCLESIASAAGGREVVFFRHALAGGTAGGALLESTGPAGTPAFDWLLDRTRRRSPEVSEGAGGEVAVEPHYLMERPNPVPEQPSAAERDLARDREGAARSDWKWALRQLNYFAAEKLLMERLRQRPPGPAISIAQLDTGYTPNCQFADTSYAGAFSCTQPWRGYPILDVDRARDFFSNPISANGTDPLTAPTRVPESRQPGHGTRTGSVLASPRGIGVCKPVQNGDTVWGTAPPGVKVVPVRVTDGIILGLPRGIKTLFPPLDHRVVAVSLGVEHVARRNSPHFSGPVQIISMSMGGESDPGSGRLRCVIDKAEQNGVIVIAAAGQFPAPGILKWLLFQGKQPVAFPANFPSTIAVAGSTVLATPWKDSCRGPRVDVTAPAEYVWRADTDCGHGESIDMGRGTSFATALTAGVTSMWVQYHGYDELRTRYGRALTSALRWLLVNHGTRTPAEVSVALDNDPDPAVATYRPLVRAAVAKLKWKKDEFASGLLDAHRLLKAELPTLAQVCGAEKQRRNAQEWAAICASDMTAPIPASAEGWEQCAGPNAP